MTSFPPSTAYVVSVLLSLDNNADVVVILQGPPGQPGFPGNPGLPVSSDNSDNPATMQDIAPKSAKSYLTCSCLHLIEKGRVEVITVI